MTTTNQPHTAARTDRIPAARGEDPPPLLRVRDLTMSFPGKRSATGRRGRPCAPSTGSPSTWRPAGPWAS